MIPTVASLIMSIMDPVHTGEANGIPWRYLMCQVNYRLAVYAVDPFTLDGHGDCRAFRLIYVRLPLISGNFGLAIPATWDEILTFERYIFSKVPGDDAAVRVAIVKAKYAHLAPQPKQMSLEMGR